MSLPRESFADRLKCLVEAAHIVFGHFPSTSPEDDDRSSLGLEGRARCSMFS